MAISTRNKINILILAVSLSLPAAAQEHKAPAEHATAQKPAAATPAKPAVAAAKPEVPPVAVEQAKAQAHTPAPSPVKSPTPAPRRVAAAAPPAAKPSDTAKVIEVPIVTPAAVTAPHTKHWSYEGATGPHAWARLAPEYAKCGNGERQSPIDIREGMKLDLDPIAFEYRPSSFRVIDNGHTIQANVNGWNSIRVMGRRYRLEQFHFHRPSEETIDGQQFEMVVHMVHKDSEGRLAVVAVLVEAGARQPIIQTVLNNLPLEKGDEIAVSSNIDFLQMLPENRRYFTYMGSLTTPPCTENVLWIVMKQPVQATTEQLNLFSRMYPMNARPTQAAGGRTIKESN